MYDTKTLDELMLLAEHLREQIARHPELTLERFELEECEHWIARRRKEAEPAAKAKAAGAA